MTLTPHWALIHHLCSHIIVLIITGDVNVTSVAPPQQRMTAQGLWTARHAISVLHLAHSLYTHTVSPHPHKHADTIQSEPYSMCPHNMGCLSPFGLDPAGFFS